jgi:hypothetical protein
MSISKMIDQYKTEAELREFAQAQMKTLLQVQKKNKELQDEINHLKKLVVEGNALPIVNKDSSQLGVVGSNEEEIAKIELNKLKIKSMDAEPLTLEEAKRVEIYSKILTSRMTKDDNNFSRDVQELNSDALIAIAESDEKKAE